ncbi:hypothetical protein RCL1_003536 [Eukaryota sp. TZLM3-RCL]
MPVPIIEYSSTCGYFTRFVPEAVAPTRKTFPHPFTFDDSVPTHPADTLPHPFNFIVDTVYDLVSHAIVSSYQSSQVKKCTSDDIITLDSFTFSPSSVVTLDSISSHYFLSSYLYLSCSPSSFSLHSLSTSEPLSSFTFPSQLVGPICTHISLNHPHFQSNFDQSWLVSISSSQVFLYFLVNSTGKIISIQPPMTQILGQKFLFSVFNCYSKIICMNNFEKFKSKFGPHVVCWNSTNFTVFSLIDNNFSEIFTLNLAINQIDLPNLIDLFLFSNNLGQIFKLVLFFSNSYSIISISDRQSKPQSRHVQSKLIELIRPSSFDVSLSEFPVILLRFHQFIHLVNPINFDCFGLIQVKNEVKKIVAVVEDSLKVSVFYENFVENFEISLNSLSSGFVSPKSIQSINIDFTRPILTPNFDLFVLNNSLFCPKSNSFIGQFSQIFDQIFEINDGFVAVLDNNYHIFPLLTILNQRYPQITAHLTTKDQSNLIDLLILTSHSDRILPNDEFSDLFEKRTKFCPKISVLSNDSKQSFSSKISVQNYTSLLMGQGISFSMKQSFVDPTTKSDFGRVYRHLIGSLDQKFN